MAALLALAGALGWGVGDFLGGIASRRLAVLTVLVISQTAGLVGVYVWVVLAGEPFPGVGELLPAAAGGVAALAGLAALYRGFALGAMGIVAPISAAAPIVPLSVDAAQGEVPTAAQWLGVGLVLTGIVVLSWESAEDGRARISAGAGLAVVAALGFGLFVADIAALLTATALTAPRHLLPLVVAVGVFDTAANVLFAAATTRGAVGIVAVLSSLYPVVTVVLAWLVLGERLGTSKRVGGAAALAGAALVAVG